MGELAEGAKINQLQEQTEISLWERLGKAEMLDIESSFFSWDRLSSLHHTEHTSSNEHSEDEMNRVLEVWCFCYTHNICFLNTHSTNTMQLMKEYVNFYLSMLIIVSFFLCL